MCCPSSLYFFCFSSFSSGLCWRRGFSFRDPFELCCVWCICFGECLANLQCWTSERRASSGVLLPPVALRLRSSALAPSSSCRFTVAFACGCFRLCFMGGGELGLLTECMMAAGDFRFHSGSR